VAPLLARSVFGLPLLTWTVRSADDRKIASRWADQIIFEGGGPEIRPARNCRQPRPFFLRGIEFRRMR
jgi:hypothetical protein